MYKVVSTEKTDNKEQEVLNAIPESNFIAFVTICHDDEEKSSGVSAILGKASINDLMNVREQLRSLTSQVEQIIMQKVNQNVGADVAGALKDLFDALMGDN